MSMKKKVLVTGSRGTIGSVLSKELPHDTTDFDLPESSVEDYEHLLKHAKGHDTLVHLAWDFNFDGPWGDALNLSNVQGMMHVYEAAVIAGVSRVIVASSVHADKFTGHRMGSMLKPFDLPLPDSPYGASKVMLEALGRYYADAKGLEVVCIRFGGVNREDHPPAHPKSERQVWLSQRDCAAAVKAAVEAKSIPYNYTIFYAVSDNTERMHDTSNPFGWHPVDGAKSE